MKGLGNIKEDIYEFIEKAYPSFFTNLRTRMELVEESKKNLDELLEEYFTAVVKK